MQILTALHIACSTISLLTQGETLLWYDLQAQSNKTWLLDYSLGCQARDTRVYIPRRVSGSLGSIHIKLIQ